MVSLYESHRWPEGIPREIMDPLLSGDPESAARLARGGENRWVELKSAVPYDAQLARVLTAFANSGGGVLIVGVDDNGELVGWSESQALSAHRQIRSAVAGMLPNLTLVRRGDYDDKWLNWVIVSASDRPVITAEGSYWHRSGSVNLRSLPPPAKDTPLPIVPSPRDRPIRVFVAMSFREEKEPALADYWNAMQRAAEKANAEFIVQRIDQIEGDYAIMQQIYKEIEDADLVIADLTLSPPNVYLEIGYARGRDKTVIQMCRDDTTWEFDVRDQRTLIYRNATMLEELLLRSLNAMY